MNHTAIPTQLVSIKYWHDKTIHTPGWKRLLPLAGLLAVAVAMLVKLAYASLSYCLRPLLRRLLDEAELARNQANATPPLKASELNFSWLSAAIADGLKDGAKQSDNSTCTCFSGMENQPGAHCEYHGRYY